MESIESRLKNKITTIKIGKETKSRIDKLRTHKRETYEDIIKNLINILNLCKINPLKARSKLLAIDKVHKQILK